MKKIFPLFIIALFLVLTACTTLKRYSSATLSGDDPSLVSIDLFGYTLYSADSDVPHRTLWDMNATAQANLLDILNKRYPDNEWFINSLSNSYLSAGVDEERLTDYTSRDLRLILSVSRKRDYSNIGRKTPAADRIEYLKFRITLPDSMNIRFTGWNRYSTEYAEIDIAGVSFNRSFDIGADADVSESGYLKRSGALSAGSNLSMKEEQKVKYRYLKLNGKINDRQIEIEEEGTRETDLTGNIIADVSVSFGAFRERVFIPYLLEQPGKESIMTLQGSDMYVPDIDNKAEAVIADLEVEFLYRHVARGSKTFQEWDDHVEYYTGKKTEKITLFYRDDYLPPLHVIGAGNSDERVMVKTHDDKWYTLKFRNYSEATIFFDWMQQYCKSIEKADQPIQIGRDKLYINGQELTGNLLNSNKGLSVIPYY